ncbi:unnamed protein product, partial [Heligmosomoides polygyrus]
MRKDCAQRKARLAKDKPTEPAEPETEPKIFTAALSRWLCGATEADGLHEDLTLARKYIIPLQMLVDALQNGYNLNADVEEIDLDRSNQVYDASGNTMSFKDAVRLTMQCNVRMDRRNVEQAEGEEESSGSSSSSALALKTCLDDEIIEEKRTQGSEADEVEAGVWEEAGEIDFDEKGAKRDKDHPAPHAAKMKAKTPVAVAESKKGEGELIQKPLAVAAIRDGEVKIEGQQLQNDKKPKPAESEKQKEEKESTKGKSKKELDDWAAYKHLEETQPDLIEYKSIMGPVNLEMLENRSDNKAGSLGDLLLKVNKAKADKKERLKRTEENAGNKPIKSKGLSSSIEKPAPLKTINTSNTQAKTEGTGPKKPAKTSSKVVKKPIQESTQLQLSKVDGDEVDYVKTAMGDVCAEFTSHLSAMKRRLEGVVGKHKATKSRGKKEIPEGMNVGCEPVVTARISCSIEAASKELKKRRQDKAARARRRRGEYLPSLSVMPDQERPRREIMSVEQHPCGVVQAHGSEKGDPAETLATNKAVYQPREELSNSTDRFYHAKVQRESNMATATWCASSTLSTLVKEALSLRQKIAITRQSIHFLRRCARNRVVPSFISRKRLHDVCGEPENDRRLKEIELRLLRAALRTKQDLLYSML